MLKSTNIAATRLYNRIIGIAIEYERKTGNPLSNITGVVGEYLVVKKLKLKLATFNQPGYDAISSTGIKYQVKTSRIVTSKSSKGQWSAIKTDASSNWDYLALCILSMEYKIIELYILPKNKVPKLRSGNSLTRSDVKHIKPKYRSSKLVKEYNLST